MARDLPPLNAIRMFEAAARYKNFTRAADQLCVTQGAVSRQVKVLEEDLQQSLFKRHGPKIELTVAGERLYKAAVEALAILRRETVALKRASASPALTISVLPSFASKWLIPRIAKFKQEFPDTDLLVSTAYEPIEFETRPDIDIAIRYSRSVSRSDLYSELLFGEKVFPVCSPAFRKRLIAGCGPKQIAKEPLLHTTKFLDQWEAWFAATGVKPPANKRGLRFGDQLLLHQAAAEGQGVALARSLIVADDLATGRLVRLGDVAVPSLGSYWFVCSAGREIEEPVQRFLRWLRKEVASPLPDEDQLQV